MSYHDRTFDLLGIAPAVSSEAMRTLEGVARRTGLTLPASVREWYSHQGAVALLRTHSNDDPPIEMAALGKPLNDTHGGGPHDLVARGLLPFKFENQAVCVWAISLDGTDDPPVVADVDTQFSQWTECADTFSTYIYCCMWDHAVAMARPHSVMGQRPPIQPAALAHLRRAYPCEPVTHAFPGDVQHRFGRADYSILLWTQRERQTDWFLTADSSSRLEELLREVWSLAPLSEHAYADNAVDEALLARLRADLPGDAVQSGR